MPVLITLLTVLAAEPAPGHALSPNRTWERLHPAAGDAELRKAFAEAGALLGDWRLQFAGVDLDGPALQALAAKEPGEPFTRVVREALKRPVDVEDFAFFLDDLLEAGANGLRGVPVWVGPGRARAAGLLVHPDDVFAQKPRRYGEVSDRLELDEPEDQSTLEPAADGDPLGPRWTARYQNPEGDQQLMAALKKKSPQFAKRLHHLVEQLRAQGGDVELASTVRNRKRGYLMWGSFALSQATNAKQVDGTVKLLRRLNWQWKHNVPIAWRADGDWENTVEAARQMKETYDVVYATRRGAQFSDHYDGRAVDVVVVGLPRTLKLKAPDGATQTFDLSDPDETRDLSLTPALVDWIEQHYGFKKLRADYPHWSDAARAK